MYVVLLTYTAPPADIDRALPDHVDWLTRQYEAGYFLVSGRRNPRTGGVIVARPMSRMKLDAILATDPFAMGELARYEVIEFRATRTAPELATLREPLSETPS
ncbi:YciI family protein [Gandjariella thermophila]|uniref:YCII-related domain-containing protein n=1 Tax=Gandjariella thermophila TaxID=1931992 RepID=A0A4D4J5E6_9PSEU|nr:YciI family protein [Gandjariella thermophila]GDY29958.1 hypothetical protein GTS_15910 [Gandjariella thermophila]